MTDRKPDYVFNVWSDNVVVPSYGSTPDKLQDLLSATYNGHRITHRIRVFMKDKPANDCRALTEGQLLP